jgi:hypothetical protein
MGDESGPSLRHRLARRQPLGGYWTSTGSAAVIELAASGSDCAVKIEIPGLGDLPSLIKRDASRKAK